ncbi:MAG: hypothetical protein ACLSVD_07380 [Eggerthellaceae bacterium]
MEKKPLARFRPGSTVLSLEATVQPAPSVLPERGYRLRARRMRHGATWPEAAVGLALRARDRGCVACVRTTNRSWVTSTWDAGRLASEAGLANVLVSNGW